MVFSYSMNPNPLMTEARRKVLMLPDYDFNVNSVLRGVGKTHAESEPEGGSSGDSSGGSMSSGGSSSSSGSFFRPVSPRERSDVSDGDMGIGESKKKVDDGEEEAYGNLREVVVYVEEGGHLVEKGRVFMIGCWGYYTFARTIRECIQDPTQRAHVIAPWAPDYWWAEYYARDQGGERVLLDPLNLKWADFSKEVDHVVMKPMGHEASGLTLVFMRDTDVVEWELTIPSLLVHNSESYRKMVHIFVHAYLGKDPDMEYVPIDPYMNIRASHPSTRYLDEAGLELDYPDDPSDEDRDRDVIVPVELLPGVGGEGEQHHLPVYLSSSSNESIGEIVEDDMEIGSPKKASDDGMDITDEEHVEVAASDDDAEAEEGEEADDEDEDEDEDAAESDGDHGWNEFLASLVRVEFML